MGKESRPRQGAKARRPTMGSEIPPPMTHTLTQMRARTHAHGHVHTQFHDTCVHKCHGGKFPLHAISWLGVAAGGGGYCLWQSGPTRKVSPTRAYGNPRQGLRYLCQKVPSVSKLFLDPAMVGRGSNSPPPTDLAPNPPSLTIGRGGGTDYLLGFASEPWLAED